MLRAPKYIHEVHSLTNELGILTFYAECVSPESSPLPIPHHHQSSWKVGAIVFSQGNSSSDEAPEVTHGISNKYVSALVTPATR